jgi:hypothetical protein
MALDSVQRGHTVFRPQIAWLAVAAQFLALIRILGEIFRIKQFEPARYTLPTIEPFVASALFTSCCVALSVGLCTLGYPRSAVVIAAFNILALLVYKVAFM